MRVLPSVIPGRLSFRQQLLVTVSVGILCLAIASSFVISNLSTKTVRARLVDQGRQVTGSFAMQSTLALLYQSPENASDAVRATLEFPDVQGVAIYDKNHRALLASGKDPLPPGGYKHWPSGPRLVHEASDAWYFVAPVYPQPSPEASDSPFVTDPPTKELLGFVRIVVSKETLKRMGADILRSNLIISTTFAGLLFLVLLTLTARLTTPLQNLANIMRRANLGERLVQPSLTGPKDIIEMEGAFNTMAGILRAREDELATARDAALESARIKGEFAANVSHELRTPLNGVLGMLELLDEEGLSVRQREYVDVARKSGESLLALIGNILDFSRIESGKLELDVVEFDLLDILDDVVNLLASQVQQKALDLQYLVSWNAPVVFRGDSARLRQVLINLVGNAVKFTKHGEVAINVREVRTTKERCVLRFEVRDTGIGVSSEAQERIFKAFSQVDGSTTRQYGGTGLGLSISRQLVELMGGEIGVQSEFGKGSTFWFTCELDRVPGQSVIPRMDLASLTDLHILIVDDSTTARRYLEQTLGSWEIAYTSIGDGSQALQLLHDMVGVKPFDVVLIDELMPSMSGYDFVRQIRAHTGLADVKVVMMTHTMAELRAQPAGVTGWLTKPLRAPMLRDCLAECSAQSGLAIAPAPASQELCFGGGRRVLIVEDNRFNQQVALGMLARLGCQAEIAATGREALQAVSKRTFDLILMDCQMPEIDGYEATARIRSQQTDIGRVPIVAMTAHAQEGDGDRCRAAGMDDYLSKPLRLNALRNSLARWLIPVRPDADASNEGPVPSLGSPQSDGPLDPTLFRELQETVGDAIEEVIRLFLEDTPNYIEAIVEAVSSRKIDTATRIAHTIKGSASNVGAIALADICKDLEGARTTNDALDLVNRLHWEYQRVATALQSEFRPASTSIVITQKEDPPRVLIVDDDRTLRLALRNVLLRDGYQIEEAVDGVQAVALCRRQMPDLLLMDGLMPALDGFDACRQIRQLPESNHVPVLIITALEDDDAVDRAFSSGATDYVPKPLRFPVIRHRVARLLKASQAEKHVHRLAYHDPLTSLPNRTLFRRRLEERLSLAKQRKTMIALLFLDLDRFKLVNDTLGHDTGDLLLQMVSKRLQGCVRSNDMVARLGGDEFTIVLGKIDSSRVAARVAKKICRALSSPFVFAGQEVYVTTSIGIAVYPDDGTDIGTLIKHADTAMFRAKERGDHYQFYEVEMELVNAKRLRLEGDLRRALDRNEFVLHYQPQVDLETGQAIGMEALIRWQHPEHGLVSPDDFIPLAEETGLIGPIGEWVLRQACTQLRAWLDHGFAPIEVAINLSGRQLEKGDLARKVRDILNQTGLPGHSLELEITESTLMKRAEDVIPTLHQLEELGVKLAIDDFGTGYSSLSYLKRFPIDKVKIDRSFVRDITKDPDDAAIVKAIIALARTLRLKVVAEGVENHQQERFLKELGCHFIQGYYVSKPLDADSFKKQILRPSDDQRTPLAKIYPLRRSGG
jgi:diguanylate cyclase (GGDEF)-like protein